MDINKDIGIRIRKLRDELNETLKDTAEAISREDVSLSDNQLGLYELGLRKVPPNVVIALAQHFGTTTDFILTGKVHSHAPIEIAASMKDKADLSQMSDKDKKFILDLIEKLNRKSE